MEIYFIVFHTKIITVFQWISIIHLLVIKLLSESGCVPLPGQVRPKTSIFPPGDGERQPAWVAYDKRVLAFSGFFEEVEINRNIEELRVRPVKIYFYLEDDTVQGKF